MLADPPLDLCHEVRRKPSGWAAFLVSAVWLGSVVACGMTVRMTSNTSKRSICRPEFPVARQIGGWIPHGPHSHAPELPREQ
jgi:hypothetical protein